MLAHLNEQMQLDPDFELPSGYVLDTVKVPQDPNYQMCWSILNEIIQVNCDMSLDPPFREQPRVIKKQQAKSERQQPNKRIQQ